MLYIVMRHIRNFFPGTSVERLFTIEDGKIDLSSFVKNGQYFLIEGSDLNDGVHLYDEGLSLLDEKFNGRITALKLPRDFIETVKRMEEDVKSGKYYSPYASESFGGYSYSRAQGSNGPANVFEVYKSDLSVWRKL